MWTLRPQSALVIGRDRELWIQHSSEFERVKVGGELNPADVLTKLVPQEMLARHCLVCVSICRSVCRSVGVYCSVCL